MNEHHIDDLLGRVRARWRRLAALQAVVRAALAASVVLLLAVVVGRWGGHTPALLATVALASLALLTGVVIWALRPAREVPSNQRVARFIEEAAPALDDRLATAVDLTATAQDARPAFAAPMIADAARRASDVDPAAVVPSERLRRAGFQAAASLLLFSAVGFGGRSTVREAVDSLSLTLFPSHVSLDVVPGDARVNAGTPLVVEARLVGSTAPVAAQLLRATSDAEGAEWRAADMAAAGSGVSRFAFGAVEAPFKYRVRAGAALSPIYTVSVARAPRVARIDLDYTFPKELGLPPRTEEDGGDVYAPAGTHVALRIHPDRPAATGRLLLGGQDTALKLEQDGSLSADLTVAENTSYRISLADDRGLTSSGDTEYFVRTLEDRPPEVHIVRPARDRTATRLEEVPIEARADDDFGIASMDLVYAVRGRAEQFVPFALPGHAASVSGKRTLYLEDLNVQPGDFISYYVRARDISRGKHSSEARSDLFFLEVKPFDQEFTLAQSQGGGGGAQIDDLVQAQKDIIVATWKLDRRSQAASATSGDDVRSVGRAESQLKTRVEEVASSFRESTLRDPRSRGAGGRAGQALPGEDDMTAAATAMGRAAATLEELKTAEAVPPEMDALNHLLQAQADIKSHQVAPQRGSGNGQNRSNVDISSLFDKELQRQQQTNYETKASAARENDTSVLDKIRELARRQDELNQQQQDLARKRGEMSAEAAKRELERLTREQSDLRQKAEDLAQQMNQSSQSSQGSQSSQSARGSQSPQSAQGSQSSQSSRGSQSSQSAQGSQSPGAGERQMRAISEAMRSATSDLRAQNPGQASEQGAQAADRLRALADQLQSQGPGAMDDRRRALGDLGLEARQLADAQRQIASQLSGGGRGPAGQDALRRLAGEEDRLAERAGRVESELQRQATAAPAAGADGKSAAPQQAVSDAAREFASQGTTEHMRQAAEATRAASAQADASKGGQASDGLKSAASSEAAAARDLDRLADRLAGAVDGPKDAESERLAALRAQAEALRAQIDKLAGDLKAAGDRATAGRSDARGNAAEVARLQNEYAQALQKAQTLVDQMKREDPTMAQGGLGFTFEGQGMVLSAPGTEAFKQDFAKWNQLHDQATVALGRVESAISNRLQARQAHDRLAAGGDDEAPAAYQTQVNSYFKALADRRKP